MPGSYGTTELLYKQVKTFLLVHGPSKKNLMNFEPWHSTQTKAYDVKVELTLYLTSHVTVCRKCPHLLAVEVAQAVWKGLVDVDLTEYTEPEKTNERDDSEEEEEQDGEEKRDEKMEQEPPIKCKHIYIRCGFIFPNYTNTK